VWLIQPMARRARVDPFGCTCGKGIITDAAMRIAER
jgi:hypothetical protein